MTDLESRRDTFAAASTAVLDALQFFYDDDADVSPGLMLQGALGFRPSDQKALEDAIDILDRLTGREHVSLVHR